ncbi:putative thymidylate synthase [Pseudomonas phage PhiPA3]|uniref:thymidylate synthase n=1 Tax=Pseudomonas phage PhiPA3 TaxID=998086 RepID=F8SJB1_BPPA3|nr:putative thymidylate synthase [Pseudomonas phage PhiPA3]AEH03697.1 putative thymidylate synthase [Pseudomonas phage PhiPA3]
MHAYLQLLEDIKKYGVFKGDRTGTGTQSLFGRQFRFDLKDNNLPVVTTKFVHTPSVEVEHVWMKNGLTNLKFLLDHNVRIWNEWCKPGTEVRVPVDEGELVDLVQRKFKYVDFEMHHSNEIEEDYKFILDGARTNGEKGAVLLMSGKAWMDVERFGPGPTTYDFYGHARRVWQIVCGETTTLKVGEDGFVYRLVDGDLGPVYGKTWRNIEDTRIIKKAELQNFLDRKFTFVVDVPGTSLETDRAVVTRNIDQLAELLHDLEHNPDSRRLIICAWDPALVDEQALPPCHAFIQFWTRKLELSERLSLWVSNNANEFIKHLLDYKGDWPTQNVIDIVNTGEYQQVITQVAESDWLKFVEASGIDLTGIPERGISCQLYQRSVDAFLGLPFNITFYSIMTHALANQFNMVAEEFIWTGGDCHIYSNHQEQTDLQLTRNTFPTPKIHFREKGKPYLELDVGDFVIEGYEYHPHIAGKVAV